MTKKSRQKRKHLEKERLSVAEKCLRPESVPLKKESIRVLFVFRLFKNGCILRTRGNMWPQFCIFKAISEKIEKNVIIYQEPKLAATHDNT